MSAQPATAEIGHPYIEQRQGVQGGRPVIRGTRFPVSSIVASYREGASIEEILRDFPHLTPAQVHDALSYYYDHQSEIEDELRELTDIASVMDRYPPTLSPIDLVRR